MIEQVLQLFRERGQSAYLGEPVSQTEHALQAAWAAEQAGASSALITAALLWIVGAPIIFLLSFSFRSGSVITPGGFTLANYQAVYANPLTYTALVNKVRR